MNALAWGTAVILSAIAFIHGVWGFGIWWPTGDEASLTRAVFGAPGATRMPASAASFFVAGALATTALLALLMGRVLPAYVLPKWLIALGGFGAASVFIARGVVGYFPFWARLTPEAPFRTYDYWAYSPLCIVVGGALLSLLINYLRTKG